MSFKICSIGCGLHSNKVHGPSYKKYMESNPSIKLAGCCDIDEQKAKSFKERFGFEKYYTDMDKMLSQQQPDAVCLTAPVNLTAKLAEKILNMGFPLILEKPPGQSKEEVLRLIEIAESKGIPNRVAFNRRYAPLTRKLKELLNSDFMPGDIQSVQYDMFRVNRRDADFSATAIHAIDVIRFITASDYKHIRFVYHEHPELGTGVANIHMMCSMTRGTIVQLNICPVTGVNIENAVVNLYNNTIFLEFPNKGINPTGRLISLQDTEITLDITANDMADGIEEFGKFGFYYENMSFFDDLRAGRKPEGDLKSSLQSVEVADCIRKRLTDYIAY